jgi:hypothetical protein
MKIYAPVKDTCGYRASVLFTNGVGETNDPWLIEWFRLHGYKLETENCEKVQKSVVKTEEKVQESSVETDVVDFDAMNPNELREWMKANGYGRELKNIRNKEKLLEIIRG